jgi:hypothetical protein
MDPRNTKKFLAILIVVLIPIMSWSQSTTVTSPNGTGAWYMYFWNTEFKEGPWGLQGDLQRRNWDAGSDLEQLLLRGGLTYQPKDTKMKLTLGYGHITSGEFGSGKSTSTESRIYQEALMPQKIGGRLYFKHRFRFEQRFVESQDFRTRFRYNLFLNIPLNNSGMVVGTVYLALYNELFINGQKAVSDTKTVELFDRNRFYTALGYVWKDGLNIQFGFLKQTTDAWSKNQIQLSLHHKF